MTNYHWTADRLIHYPLISDVCCSPDGDYILYTVRQPQLTEETGEFRHQIMWVRVDGDSDPKTLTRSGDATKPRSSPDGRHFAYLHRATDADPAALWIMSLGGGEPWPITTAENGIHHSVVDFRWSPTGTQIAFAALPFDQEVERRRKRRADVHHWRSDFEHVHLFVVEVNTGLGASTYPVRQITGGKRHFLSLDWLPDGSAIVAAVRDNPLHDSWPSTKLVQIDLTSSPLVDMPLPLRVLGDVAAKEPQPIVAPSGQWIACEVGVSDNGWPYASRIHLFPTDGSAPRSLADVSDAQPTLIGWAADGLAVYVANQSGLGTEILALPVDGTPARIVLSGDRHITATHVNRRDHVALALEDFAEPNSIYVAKLAAFRPDTPPPPRKIAQPQNGVFPDGPLPEVETLTWHTPDGYEIEGILYLPSDYDPASDPRIPLLLHVHGGPMSIFQRQYVGFPYYYTPAALCERGIAILRCNPRGSGGYGRDFRFANRKDWGGGDYRDLQQGIDTVIAMGIADPDRLGICGWSYGGYMTSWTLTQTNRFRAASIGAPVTNPMTFNATADIPSFVPDYFGGEYWEAGELYRSRSPMFHVHQVRTPAIIQHGDADKRVPLEQGLQYYHALRQLGVPVEMYIYPRQEHALAEPRLLADAIQRNTEWFAAQLGTAGDTHEQ